MILSIKQFFYLDDFLKEEIFNTIAPAVGYVRGRDTIELSRADFLSFSDEEMARLKRLSKTGGSGVLGWLFRLISLAAMGAAGFYAFRFIRRRRQGRDIVISGGPTVGLDSDGTADFELDINNQQGIERLRDIAGTNPEAIASIVEDWVNNESPGAELAPQLEPEEVNA